MPTIAVLIPTYNRAQFLHDCLKSILKQSHSDLIAMVYDDGSSDNTSEILNALNDVRVRLISNKINNGVVYARNALLNCAREMGVEFACWQDSDDVSHPARLWRQLDFITKTKTPMVLSGWNIFNQEHPRFPIIPAQATNREIIFASAFFNPKSVPDFREINRHPTPTTLGGEDVVWREDLKAIHGEPPELRDELYFVRRHAERISIWRRNSAFNPDWHKRMTNRVK